LGELDGEVREYLKDKGLSGVQNSGAKLETYTYTLNWVRCRWVDFDCGLAVCAFRVLVTVCMKKCMVL